MRLGRAVAAKRPSVTARKLSCDRGRAVTVKEKGCGERREQRGGQWDRSLQTERACWYLSFSNFVVV